MTDPLVLTVLLFHESLSNVPVYDYTYTWTITDYTGDTELPSLNEMLEAGSDSDSSTIRLKAGMF